MPRKKAKNAGKQQRMASDMANQHKMPSQKHAEPTQACKHKQDKRSNKSMTNKPTKHKHETQDSESQSRQARQHKYDGQASKHK